MIVKKRRLLRKIIVAISFICIAINAITPVTFAAQSTVDTKKLSLSGKAHVQTFGDVPQKIEMNQGIQTLVLGTRGMAKRVERVNIKLFNNTGYAGGIEYKVHVQGIGWMPWVSGGEDAGTSGQSKRLEGIKIRLTGELAKHYSVRYRVHIQTYGDSQGWVYNGAVAGTTGEAKRLEEVRVQIIPKEEKDKVPTLSYRVHRQTYGWEQKWLTNGQTSGTTGQAKRLEGIQISLDRGMYDGDLMYCAHIQGIGWAKWSANGEVAGTVGQAKRLEAIEIVLTGEISNYYDVYYRVHSQKFGWMGWTCNGRPSGTSGYGYRLEAIQIKLVKKGDPIPMADALTNTKDIYKRALDEQHNHSHKWQPETRTIHHEAVYEEKVTPVQKLEEHVYCGQCGEDLTWKDISKHQLASKYKTIINGKEWTMYKCSSTYGKYIWVTYYEKEKTLIRAAYDEEVFTGRYICECGAVK